MRIAVVGAGGVGGYFGGRLAQAGFDTTFIVRGTTLEALRARPLRVESIHGDFEVPVHVIPSVSEGPGPGGGDDARAAHAAQVPRYARDDRTTFDAILITVKTYQLAEAARSIVPFIGDETVVVPLQNGVEAADVLMPIVGENHVAGGLAAVVSFVVEPGHIKHAATDPLVMFGELDNRRSERLERLREAFTAAGVRAEIPADIHHSLWTKFLFITTLSAVGALTRVPIGVWRSIPEIRKVADQSLCEVAAVAAAKGIELEDDAIERTWSRYDALAAASTSSLQRDVMEGKMSELDAQLGAVIRFGRELGVPTPVNDVLYACLLGVSYHHAQ